MKAIRILGVLFVLGGGAAMWCFLRPSDRAALSNRLGAAEAMHAAAGNLGYSAAFEAELKKIGQISPEEFAQRYGGKVNYTPRLSWDPTTAKFWDRFNLDPKQPGLEVRVRGAEEREMRAWNKAARERQVAEHFKPKPLPDGEPIMVPAQGMVDFRLNADELAKFKQNGFVVSERLGAPSCTEMYYRIYKRDLPVFISADAVLHAWHRSFDAILVEIETQMLMPALQEILADMSAQLPEAQRNYGGGVCGASLEDADYFLAVARSLLAGGPVNSALGQDGRVAQTLEACRTERLQAFHLFGKYREVDFSQFKPRGHYEKTEELRRYFKAMMWCGRTDLRVAGNPRESSPRELGAAIVLHDLLRQSGKFERWQQFDRIMQTFVGQTDSMTFAQLGVVLAAAGIRSPADVKDLDTLAALQARIAACNFGAQEIRGDVFEINPHSPQKFILPRSFTFLGQKFAVDSWVTAKLVFDDVRWNSRAVMRRIPSCLDVAFAVFGNDHTVPILVERMNNPAGRQFRDGPDNPYQHSLAAARNVIDAKPDTQWKANLYNGWLGCLRELSAPTTDAKYPEAMRTQAWAMKSLNTQLASWTQLRHDTILYVKQSYTMGAACYYPAGFVEPVPNFWARLEQMSARAAGLIEETLYPNATLRQQHTKFLGNFAEKMATLRAIAEKELAQRELTKQETKFLEDVIEIYHVREGSGSRRMYAGWYPGLFYLGGPDSLKWDALVADVHTNPPTPIVGDPGCVLHQGVGGVDLLMIAIDNGKDRMVYAGPVLSHYDFEMPGVSRKSDNEWKNDLRAGRKPPRPEWTHGYLVQGVNKEVANYLGE
jgi:hypothetical protein